MRGKQKPLLEVWKNAALIDQNGNYSDDAFGLSIQFKHMKFISQYFFHTGTAESIERCFKVISEGSILGLQHYLSESVSVGESQ